jgi:hypothetical protein
VQFVVSVAVNKKPPPGIIIQPESGFKCSTKLTGKEII